ncbi:sterol acyltransferase [Maudiozyma humilis]|uniref:O-acyltransferase n=1 Tax=Maudiozyma humilis TaxID=51915 RepID=A0AAV5RWZ4_MAUHU|nr:sterol acyltransferase [Kazachstania humilis]
MTESFLRDKKFVEIQRLNSPSNQAKRRSLVVSDAAADEAVRTPASASAVASAAASRGNSPGVLLQQEPASAVDQRAIERHARQVKARCKVRYRNDRVISYFDDVDFEYRPSILDGSINEPFRMSFEGPTLEREIKLKEKEKRTLLRKEKFPGAVAEKSRDSEMPQTGDKSEETPQSDNDAASATSQSSGDSSTTYMHEHLVSDFSGLYVALWMAIGLGVARILVDNYIDDGGSALNGQIMRFLRKDLFKVAFVDLCMYLCMYVPFAVHWLCRKGLMRWNGAGWAVVSVFEFWFLLFFIYLPEHVLNFHWIAKIFLFLHSLVLLMKMHSFAFYNGYLWQILEEHDYSANALAKIKDSDEGTVSDDVRDTLQKSYDFCTFELGSQTRDKTQQFPNNINVCNFFMFTMFPTIVYQIEYPRTKSIRWLYVLEKVCAIFGTIFIMVLNAQIFMYPIAERALLIRDSEWTGLADRLMHWARILVDIIPSFIVMYLLVFYLIWDAILNCIAELTCFGDRYFYGDWWNCVTWDEFSRIWNIPVHKFLLRHVYHSSISAFNFNKGQATLFTFFLSSVIHELSMYVIFRRMRLYIFFFQMLQLPLVALGNTPAMKKRTIIGNVIFWIGICTGPSVLCSLYLTL